MAFTPALTVDTDGGLKDDKAFLVTLSTGEVVALDLQSSRTYIGCAFEEIHPAWNID